MQIQHANNTSNKKNNYDILNISLNIRHMNEFSATIKQTHKKILNKIKIQINTLVHITAFI